MAGPREQPLPPDVIGRDDATEVLRAFVRRWRAVDRVHSAPSRSRICGACLLVDIARHAARAYARESELHRGRSAERASSRCSKPKSRGRPTWAPPRRGRNKVTDNANQHPDARAVADDGKGQPCQVAQERGRQGQVRRRDRRNRDRQGDHGGRGGRRRHHREDRGARGHPGRAGQRRRSRCWPATARM